MSTTASRHTKRLGAVGAAAAATMFWALSELALAPSAHADDPIADIVADIQHTTNLGDAQLHSFGVDLGFGEHTIAFQYGLVGLENLLLAPEEEVLVNGTDALTNTPEFGWIDFLSPGIPTDWTETVALTQSFVTQAGADFSTAFNDFAAGDFAAGVLFDTEGFNALFIDASNAAILGLSDSLFGL